MSEAQLCFVSYFAKTIQILISFHHRQQRLPARLHNAHITVAKAVIKPVADKSGKNPPLFPVTRGEFEHLTSEQTLCCFPI